MVPETWLLWFFWSDPIYIFFFKFMASVHVRDSEIFSKSSTDNVVICSAARCVFFVYTCVLKNKLYSYTASFFSYGYNWEQRTTIHACIYKILFCL